MGFTKDFNGVSSKDYIKGLYQGVSPDFYQGVSSRDFIKRILSRVSSRDSIQRFIKGIYQGGLPELYQGVSPEYHPRGLNQSDCGITKVLPDFNDMIR